MNRIVNCLLLAVVALLAVSCGKDDPIEPGRTSYTLVCNIPITDEMGLTCYCYEYDTADVRIDSNVIANPDSGREYTFYPAEGVDHVKVRVTSSEAERWSPTVYRLKQGENLYLTVSLTTRYTFSEPY